MSYRFSSIVEYNFTLIWRPSMTQNYSAYAVCNNNKNKPLNVGVDTTVYCTVLNIWIRYYIIQYSYVSDRYSTVQMMWPTALLAWFLWGNLNFFGTVYIVQTWCNKTTYLRVKNNTILNFYYFTHFENLKR